MDEQPEVFDHYVNEDPLGGCRAILVAIGVAVAASLPFIVAIILVRGGL